jgi:TolB-like protein/Flp pilus assembly protein TadD
MTNKKQALGGFLSELRRRRVYHVAAVYAAAAFVAAQAAQLVVAALYLPDAVFTAFVVLGFLGFPAAVVLAWLFDISPDGVSRADPIPVSGGTIAVTLPRVVLGTVVLLATGGAGTATLIHLRGGDLEVDRSIAVLPFVNIAGLTGEEYFSSGLHEDVLTTVAGIGQIRVISRNSVLPYRDTDKALRQIAAELGVAFVLTGSIRRDENRVRISVQLVDVHADEHVWAEQYDRELVDIFAVQADIAQRVARQLGARLTVDERGRIAAAPTRDMKAYDRVLRIREHLRREREDDQGIALRLAREAVEHDPGFADAYAEIGLAYIHGVDRYGHDRAQLDSAVIAARRAIKLDSLRPRGHFALGSALVVAGRFEEAIEPLSMAVRLDPSSGGAYISLGILHARQGRIDELIYWLRHAAAIDPAQAATIHLNLAVGYSILDMHGEVEEALAVVRRVRPDWWVVRARALRLALDKGEPDRAAAEAEVLVAEHPTNARAWLYAGEAYLHADRLPAARAAFEQAVRLAPAAVSDFAPAQLRLAHVLLLDGERQRAVRLLDEFENVAAAELAGGSQSGTLYMALSGAAALRADRQVAMQHLENAVAVGWLDTAPLRVDPLFENLRGDAAFGALIRRVDARVRQMRSDLERRERRSDPVGERRR